MPFVIITLAKIRCWKPNSSIALAYPEQLLINANCSISKNIGNFISLFIFINQNFPYKSNHITSLLGTFSTKTLMAEAVACPRDAGDHNEFSIGLTLEESSSDFPLYSSPIHDKTKGPADPEELASSSTEYPELDGFFHLKETIGKGGFSKVKLAIDLSRREKVAVKVVNKEKVGEELPRIHVEIETLKDLHHPHICTLHEVIFSDHHIFMIMEYCPTDLYEYIVRFSEEDHLPEPEARKIFSQLVSAVAYLHERGIAHRDLKPENVLLDFEKNVKLTDFGLCAIPGRDKIDKPVLNTLCGSPAYCAPELLRGPPYSGSKADVWSLGVMLFVLLAGQLPFYSKNLKELYKKIQVGFYLVPDWVPNQAKDLIDKMLQSNVRLRPSLQTLQFHPWIRQAEKMDQSITGDAEPGPAPQSDLGCLKETPSLSPSKGNANQLRLLSKRKAFPLSPAGLGIQTRTFQKEDGDGRNIHVNLDDSFPDFQDRSDLKDGQVPSPIPIHVVSYIDMDDELTKPPSRSPSAPAMTALTPEFGGLSPTSEKEEAKPLESFFKGTSWTKWISIPNFFRRCLHLPSRTGKSGKDPQPVPAQVKIAELLYHSAKKEKKTKKEKGMTVGGFGFQLVDLPAKDLPCLLERMEGGLESLGIASRRKGSSLKNEKGSKAQFSFEVISLLEQDRLCIRRKYLHSKDPTLVRKIMEKMLLL